MKTSPVNVNVVVLTKYKEILKPFLESISRYETLGSHQSIVFVIDGKEVGPEFVSGPNSIIIQGPDQFSMAGNGNLGLKATKTGDILYCGDDIRFLEKDTIQKLHKEAYSDDKIGILSPRLIGRGAPAQINPPEGISEVRPIEMWFPCVYIKREVFDAIGFLDEDFSDFGSDDLDFAIRAKMAGYKLCVTSKVAVKHDASPEGGPTTFIKKLGVDVWQQQQVVAANKLRKKYGVSFSTYNNFLSSGDVELLRKKEKIRISQNSRPSNEEVKAYLKTRHLYLATPAYGGWFAVNYVNSLVSLINFCKAHEITYTTSFLYNESLITRARNKMVNDFLKVEEATDFFFIDADIGFDPRDLITMMMREEDVIGAPCVRKNLRLDRIVAAVKKNPEKNFTIEELTNLTGEFVMNFPEGKTPLKFGLADYLEVQDVGTGLMRVRREVFEVLPEKYPDRWSLPMGGENGSLKEPIYMYFQSEIDEESKQYNPQGIGDYISEDYSFCRMCRRAGMKIWIAPWVKTNHLGSFLYTGDLPSVSQAGGGLR